jgi:lipopolysaccharide/colanic/teichoic acid biosynthesis glycosyltransferase
MVICLPFILFFALLIYLYDRLNPFYMPPRVGKNGKSFKMIKLRSMVVNAHKYNIDSTANDDPRITPVGKWVRKLKMDELAQIFNVVKGDMNLVGPRPQILSEVNRYTTIERDILRVNPGITDISSIVFADLGDIIEGKPDPNLAYNQLIRPWKSRLALLYIANRSIKLNLCLLFFTFTNSFARQWTLNRLSSMVTKLNGCDIPESILRRENPLTPYPPPGLNHVVEKL